MPDAETPDVDSMLKRRKSGVTDWRSALRLMLALCRRHPLRALAIAGWWISGKRMRARIRLREAVGALPNAYRIWLRSRSPVARARSPTSIAVHLHLPDATAARRGTQAIKTVIAQSHVAWTLYISGPPDVLDALSGVHDRRIVMCPGADAVDALRSAARMAVEGYILALANDARLDRHALAACVAAIDTVPVGRSPLLYGDEDAYDAAGERHTPWLKPDYDAELFKAQDFISGACALPVVALSALPDAAFATVEAVVATLLLGLAALTAVHVPEIIASRPPNTWSELSESRFGVVRDLLRESDRADVEPGPWGTLLVRYPLPAPPPLVSVIVPTRDALEVLSVCVDGVLNRTDYPMIELIIADNDSADPATMAFFDQITTDPRVRIVRWPHPYNFAAINNAAARTARGQLLCFLNNDVEVIDSRWLSALVRFAVRPGVGAVGAQLLYPDGTIQHAGVTVGLGNAAGHAHRGLDPKQPGYFARHAVAHSVAAVTAACLVVARDTFEAVGGFDAEGFAIAYNDVDLCLRVQQAGWRNVYVPQARLMHHESKTRGSDFAPEHVARYQRELALLQQRWQTADATDPMHHDRLDPGAEIYCLDMTAS